MAPAATDYKHVVLDERNNPVIAETTMKVVELITSIKAYGWDAEELHSNYPHLSMGKIYSALAYYWDHKAQIDEMIEQEAEWAEQARQRAGDSPFVQRLRVEGLLP
jgi:uncharacterized protein (DUF433 family)